MTSSTVFTSFEEVEREVLKEPAWVCYLEKKLNKGGNVTRELKDGVACKMSPTRIVRFYSRRKTKETVIVLLVEWEGQEASVHLFREAHFLELEFEHAASVQDEHKV